jgi:hypothetical protein
MRSEYFVVVGNIGTVYSGKRRKDARQVFETYKAQSESGRGRAGDEDVCIMHDGDIILEYIGKRSLSEPAD